LVIPFLFMCEIFIYNENNLLKTSNKELCQFI